MQSEKKRCFIDTCILIYAMDGSEKIKRPRAVEAILRLQATGALALSQQVLNETWRWMRARRLPVMPAREQIEALAIHCGPPLTMQDTRLAWEIEDSTGFQWWDCLLLASAIRAGCSVFLTEDMQHGRRISGLQFINPFAPADPGEAFW